ncbi:hypothetical protein Tco_0361211 [Tanacetum coccineum]
MACDVSWKSKLSTINGENVLLKAQVDFVVKERENIKLEYQKLFNSIKATRAQHKKQLDELIEHVNQKTYIYADNKLKTVDKGKYVNTKFDKSETSRTLLCVTPLPKNIAIKAKKVSSSKVNLDRSKQVTSHPPPKNEQSQTQNENVLARGISNSVRRPTSKDTKSKNRVLKNTNDKSSTAHVQKMSRSVSIDSNKCETMNSTICHANKSVLNTKSVTSIDNGSNIVCVSCGKDVFLLSHEKCVAHYALSGNASVKRALFTTLIAEKSKTLRATSVVAKSRLSIAKTPTATNKVKMDDPNITIEEYIRLEEEKLVAIYFNDTLTSEVTLSCAPTVSSLNDGIDFRISFDESDDEDCTVSIRHILGYGYGVSTYCTVLGPHRGNIDEYWWRIYESGNLEVLES